MKTLIVASSTYANGADNIPFQVPKTYAPKTDIKITAISSSTGVTCSGSFSGWYE